MTIIEMEHILATDPANAEFAIGEQSVFLYSANGTIKCKLKLDGIADIFELVHNEELFKDTQQFKTMKRLGFEPFEGSAAAYVSHCQNGIVHITMKKSKVDKIVVNGKSTNSVVLQIAKINRIRAYGG